MFVVSTAFRQIAFEDGSSRYDRVFKASISAFSMITRPSHQEISSIEDLGLGLYETLSSSALRYAATALSTCDTGPKDLIKRLSHEPVEISSPLLANSAALNDVALIDLIATHGISHARIIARRKNLNPHIANLIKLLRGNKIRHEQTEDRINTSEFASDLRDRLSDMMAEVNHRPAHPKKLFSNAYQDLYSASMQQNLHATPKALAATLDISHEFALQICSQSTYGDFLLALKSLNLSSEQAFLLTALQFPTHFTDIASIRTFIERYKILLPSNARKEVQAWQNQSNRALDDAVYSADYQPLAMVR